MMPAGRSLNHAGLAQDQAGARSAMKHGLKLRASAAVKFQHEQDTSETRMRTFHKLTREQILPGKALPWDVFDSGGTLLLRRGNVVNDAAQADELGERGIYADEAEYLASLEGREPPYDPFHIVASVSANLGYLLTHLPDDGSLQGAIESEAERLSWVAEHSPDAMLAMLQLAEPDPYPALHAVYTAILADMLAQSLGWDDDRRISTLCAAMTMNAGMHTLQHQLFKQRDPLSPEQQVLVENHPAKSSQSLIECGVQDDEWLRAVLEHHERPDGCGYPRKSRDLSEISRLIHVCDVYTAMLSPRLYRAQVSGSDAVRQILSLYTEASGNPFGPVLARQVGMYPPGTLVKLANGELAVVHKRSNHPFKPSVASLIDAKGMRNSRVPIRLTSEAEFAIAAVIPPGKAMIKVPLTKLWQHLG